MAEELSFSIPTVEREIPSAIERIVEHAREGGFLSREKSVAAMRVALVEALTNAMEHGNRLESERRVSFSGRVEGGRYGITVTDEGEGFDLGKGEPSLPPPGAKRGRGLVMLRRLLGEGIEVDGSSITLWFPKERFP